MNVFFCSSSCTRRPIQEIRALSLLSRSGFLRSVSMCGRIGFLRADSMCGCIGSSPLPVELCVRVSSLTCGGLLSNRILCPNYVSENSGQKVLERVEALDDFLLQFRSREVLQCRLLFLLVALHRNEPACMVRRTA